ncbi:MAG: hypothetical protein JW829_04965 [Pirellulales bacterium]|nr:hypothetical protein [Pirellulales bacterium]
MQPIENLRCLLEGGNPEWIPFSLDVGALSGFSKPIERTFHARTGSFDHAEYFKTDVRCFSLPRRFGGNDPAGFAGPVPAGTVFDEWGIGHWAGPEGTVDKMFSPLASALTPADVRMFPSPWIETNTDTSPITRWQAEGYPVFGYAGSIYEWSWWIRGMEQFMMDLASEPAMAEAIVAKVVAHTTQLALATAGVGVDILCFYDDAGTQRGMQISPQLWRRYIKPAWQQVLAAVRREYPAVRFFLHSCGKIDAIVPDVVELGFHMLHPVQPECMDFETVYRQFGGKIALCATLGSQELLPFGTPDDVRCAVRRLAAVAADRRCLLMPSNVIQPETPWENVLAFAAEAHALRHRR